MSDTRTVLRAFLASPGDLQEERKAVRDVVNEFNGSWAGESGYQIELLGWEETVAGYGRPQDRINRDVDQCDLFIGMIWKRWGTPPGRDGKYSSGFQEEFERAIARRRRSESPDISLYFKKVPDALKEDPGKDLEKVQEFRKRIIAEKEILFQEVSTTSDMEKAARKCITEYVIRVKTANLPTDNEESRAKRAESELENVNPEKQDPASSPWSMEGFAFLKSLVDRIGQEGAADNLNAFDVARFRLLANAISKPGNHEMAVGAHDINILFSVCTKSMILGKREIRCLVRMGFQHLGNENIPLWCWYAALSKSRLDPAIISSIRGINDDEKVGAISVLGALARELPTSDKVIKRELIVDSWFSKDSSTRVKSAALSYLSRVGTAADYSVVKMEYDRSEHGTSRAALECMVKIALRIGEEKKAQGLVLELQFDSLNANALNAVLDGFENMNTHALLVGLEHSNAQVRLRALQVLLGRSVLDRETVGRFLEDREPLIRSEAIRALANLGISFSLDEVKQILIQPQQAPIGGLLGSSGAFGSDKMGEKNFAQYELEYLKQKSEADLTKTIDDSPLIDNPAYFARADRYFQKYARQLRFDIDDCFSVYFGEKIRGMEAGFGHLSGGDKLIKDTRELEEIYRKTLTRRGLDILCRASKREDLTRIRTNLESGYTETSKGDAEYLGKHGEWADIPLLANSERPPGGGLLVSGLDKTSLQDAIAKAIVKMSAGCSVSTLFTFKIPTVILKSAIGLCPRSRFSEISDDALFGLLGHDSAEVRKAASIKAVESFSKMRIRDILHEYVGGDRYRYYNVIHWLDLGASMSRKEARKVVGATAG